MKLHILGIGGTFMSALALLARDLGHTVTGNDEHCYPPVSDVLETSGIEWTEGYADATAALEADCVIVGNTIKRGLPVIEAILNARKPYMSGPQWLAENVLHRYKVMAVSGTHGKTTTSSMLACILDYAGKEPGFLIGGVPTHFECSTSLGKGEWFVIEADEYDSAFFDKRPKFMHYRPQVAILNNLEFDHADIFPNLAAIQQQFQHFLKTIPSDGVVIKPRDDRALNKVLAQGQYSQVETIALSGNATWRATMLHKSGKTFRILHHGEVVAEVSWSLIGRFNVENALAAFAASMQAGVEPAAAARALERFKPVKRRLELKFDQKGVAVYDDFAHHPTAISKTIQALRQSGRHGRIFVALEFASYTMRSGYHVNKIGAALDAVDGAFILTPKEFSLAEVRSAWTFAHKLLPTTDALAQAVTDEIRAGDAIVVMSNRSFGNLHQALVTCLSSKLM